MTWSFKDDRPIYSQLVELIKLGIISGEWKPGDKLPSVRDLAETAGVNPNTMQRALALSRHFWHLRQQLKEGKKYERIRS